jgi:hypothetical protein
MRDSVTCSVGRARSEGQGGTCGIAALRQRALPKRRGHNGTCQLFLR